ncbi:Vigilin 1 [Neolecta irregularis DAH-3]|uniref:Vigilin 1 n=1 Tax=Neolecta irregularis (strain DAH-3) TaxID=1198029 RepID=A0A1U7LWF5_NEOID|nr:Vigilin 1 [Neolecta irregularis DAH-3]|eukprot:OLL26903.1 Vigilin 1 [Neolecta irregularis DAH-3]
MSAQIESILSETPDDNFSGVPDHVVRSDAEAANGRLDANEDQMHSATSSAGARDMDILSEDSFPSLGAPSALKANASWGAGKPAQQAQPSKTHITPQAVPHKAKPNISITHLFLESSQQQPRKEFGTKNGIGDIIRQTMLANQTQIDVSTSRSGAITFIIKGKPENVQRSRRYIMKELALRQSLTVNIPRSVLPHIIGAKGKTLKGIEERSAAKIQTPKRDDTNSSTLSSEPGNEFDEIAEEPSVGITVEGDFEGVAIAKAEIDAIVNDKTSHTSIKFTTVAPEFYNLIAGPHRINVQKWEKDWDLKIHIPVSTMAEDGQSPTSIAISGDKDQVKQAREIIENIYSDLKTTTISAQIHVPKPQHKFIVGEKGNSIQEILAESDCSVIVPPAGSLSDEIFVRGPPAKVGMGISMVMDKANSVSMTTLDILPAHKSRTDNPARHSRDLTRYFLRMKEFHRLETEHQVSIHFPRISDLEDENIKDCVWEISGKVKQNVDKVRVILRDLVKDYSPHRFAYIDIDSLLHRHIVGRNGRNLQKMNKENFVEIMLATEDESDSEVCLVYVGKPGEQLPSVAEITRALNTVKELLQKITSEAANLVRQRYTVPVKYHKSIFGPNGTTLNTFTGGSESRVRVTFGKQLNKRNRKPIDDCDDDTIIVHGPSEEVERVIREMRKYVEELKHHDVMNSYTDTFEFPQKYKKNLRGKGDANITKYREELGVNIKCGEGKIEIQGIKKNVEEARRRIESLVERLKDETVRRLKVPIEHHSALIGKNGHLVKRLEEKYAVRINFPRTGEALGDGTDRPSASDEVVIKGGKKGVLSAEDELRDLLNYEAEHGHSAVITVPSKAISRIVGKGGNTINDLKLETATRIEIERAEDKGDTATTTIQIFGTKSGVSKAKAAILEVSGEVEREVEKIMYIDSQYHRNLIGPGGSTVRSILIEAGVEGDPFMLTRMVRFPRPGTNSDLVELRGDKVIIEKVMKEFNRIVNDLKCRVTETISVPADQVSLIIGRGGSVRRDLESKYRVQLDISRISKDASQDGIVKISGMSDAVAKAKEAIANLIKKQSVNCLMVPEQFHRILADNGSTIRKLRLDYKVTVDHSGHSLPALSEHLKPRSNGSAAKIDNDNETDENSYPWDVIEREETPAGQDIPWNLKGEKTNIDKANVFIRELLEQAKKQTHIGYLSIPTIKHRYIIGPGGSRINSIRAETGCAIDVPKRIGDDVIVIRGSKDGIEDARGLIVKATATPSGASTPRNGSDHGRGRRR